MTEKIYATETYNINHSSFGGLIYKGDFDEHHSMSAVASRIILDLRFDKQCNKNAEIRNNQKKYKKGAINTYGFYK